jgi:hypothetical protein
MVAVRPCHLEDNLGISLGVPSTPWLIPLIPLWLLCGVVPVVTADQPLLEIHGDFDSPSLVSQGSPYSRRYLAVSKDSAGRRRESRPW